MFIKRVYQRILDHYFPYAKYFKPAGDGLLIVVDYNEENLKETCQKVVASAEKAVSEFKKIGEDDPMINFETPTMLGVGIARGTACRLESDETILDYSGRILNLACRLNDLARPQGVVIDGGFSFSLLLEETRKSYKAEEVFLKGLAEEKPTKIFYSKDVKVPEYAKRPLRDVEWKSVTYKSTFAELQELGLTWSIVLPTKPSDSKLVSVKVRHLPLNKAKTAVMSGGYQVSFELGDGAKYKLDGGKPTVEINYSSLEKRLIESGVKPEMEIDLEIFYPT